MLHTSSKCLGSNMIFRKMMRKIMANLIPWGKNQVYYINESQWDPLEQVWSSTLKATTLRPLNLAVGTNNLTAPVFSATATIKMCPSNISVFQPLLILCFLWTVGQFRAVNIFCTCTLRSLFFAFFFQASWDLRLSTIIFRLNDWNPGNFQSTGPNIYATICHLPSRLN